MQIAYHKVKWGVEVGQVVDATHLTQLRQTALLMIGILRANPLHQAIQQTTSGQGSDQTSAPPVWPTPTVKELASIQLTVMRVAATMAWVQHRADKHDSGCEEDSEAQQQRQFLLKALLLLTEMLLKGILYTKLPIFSICTSHALCCRQQGTDMLSKLSLPFATAAVLSSSV